MPTEEIRKAREATDRTLELDAIYNDHEVGVVSAVKSELAANIDQIMGELGKAQKEGERMREAVLVAEKFIAELQHYHGHDEWNHLSERIFDAPLTRLRESLKGAGDEQRPVGAAGNGGEELIRRADPVRGNRDPKGCTMKCKLVIACFNAGMAANVGGDVHRFVKTFDIELPEEIAEVLRDGTYYHANVVGIEVPSKGEASR